MPWPIVAEIEGDGSEVRCLLCRWTQETTSHEQAEFRIAKHLRDEHNKRMEEVDGISVPYPWDC